MDFLVHPGGQLSGEIDIPGDKSVSHRSVMLGSLCNGVTEVSGLLEGMDVLATVHAFRQMGVYIDGPAQGQLIIHGNGLRGLAAPKHPLDLGNSGTSMRLLTGLLAAQHFNSVLVGDDSLSRRPMMRVINPLSLMGAKVVPSRSGTPPVEIQAADQLSGQLFKLNVASAQVKSAILLAGLYADSAVTVIEPSKTRDHTERMLADMGCELAVNGLQVDLRPPAELQAKAISVPADISSAAFFIAGACIAKNARLLIKNVGVNPTRTGVIDILTMMGGKIKLHNRRQSTGEPVADIEVCASKLTGIQVPKHLVASAIDEFPCLMIAAACAEGKTVVTGAKELRVKESDRITSMVSGLTALGIKAKELDDGMVVEGGVIKGGEVESYDDHRISMSFAMAGLVSQQPIKIRDCRNVNTSFPGFDDIAVQAGLKLAVI